MGNKSNTAPAASLTANTSTPTTKTTTPIPPSNAAPTTAVPTTNVATTTATPTTNVATTTTTTAAPTTNVATTTATPTTNVATTTTTTAAPTTNVATTTTTAAAPTTNVATTTTTTAPTTTTTTTTTTTAATATTPTPTITSTASATKDTPTTPVSTEGTPKPTFYSVTKSLTSESDKAKSSSSAYSRWYKWSQLEQKKRDKGKIPWYMNPTVTTIDTLSPTTTTLTMTTAKIGGAQKEASDASNIAAISSFQLRSTAVYSPPHGDRVPSGRNELINTDTSIFKYYIPDNRSKEPVGNHTKATMYRMNTRSKQTPLPTQSSPVTTNDGTNVTEGNSSLPTFVSIGLQTDFEPQPMNSSFTPIRYYGKQQPQIVPISAFSNYNSNKNNFFHLTSQNTISQPVFPPIQKTPVWFNNQPHPSATRYFPSYPPAPPPTSILKNSSTVLSQDISNPLSGQTHGKALEELRKRNQNTKNGTYRVNYPPNVSFNLPPSQPPPSKASQSILRSEKLFSSQLFNRKK